VLSPPIEQFVEQMRGFGIDIITAKCEYAGSQWEIVQGPKRGLAGRIRRSRSRTG
jgi:glutamine synthetase